MAKPDFSNSNRRQKGEVMHKRGSGMEKGEGWIMVEKMAWKRQQRRSPKHVRQLRGWQNMLVQARFDKSLRTRPDCLLMAKPEGRIEPGMNYQTRTYGVDDRPNPKRNFGHVGGGPGKKLVGSGASMNTQ